jgi:hypothetical protein
MVKSLATDVTIDWWFLVTLLLQTGGFLLEKRIAVVFETLATIVVIFCN